LLFAEPSRVLSGLAVIIVAACGIALDHHCHSGDWKERCIIAVGRRSFKLPNQPQRYHRIVDVAAARARFTCSLVFSII
jgi:hypothetical protein